MGCKKGAASGGVKSAEQSGKQGVVFAEVVDATAKDTGVASMVVDTHPVGNDLVVSWFFWLVKVRAEVAVGARSVRKQWRKSRVQMPMDKETSINARGWLSCDWQCSPGQRK